MLNSCARSAIRLRGVRHNNLKNFDLDLPLNQLIVVTGLSGSGKSSLAFDTLFAEGQRRYIETFSPYARQFFDRMDKPQVDSIEGIPPAIAIEQRNAVRTTRSTVGTMTEICDYLKMLWPNIAQLHCRQCGQPVRKDSPQMIWNGLSAEDAAHNTEILITFELPLTAKLSLEESLALVSKQGYQRLLLDGQAVRLDEGLSRSTLHASRATSLTVIQDRLKPTDATRVRFIEACEQAYHFGKGKLAIHQLGADGSNSKLKFQNIKLFSNRLHCAPCDLEYAEPSPALFSFNNPVGACPACKGFGRTISIDYDLAIPDRSRTLKQGVVKPWLTGQGAESQTDLLRMCRHFEIPTDVPFEKLPKKWQDFVIEGEPDYGKDEEHEWPRAWYGIKGYFRWLESRAYKMHVRVLLSRYRAYTTCPVCQGKRLQPDALLYRVRRPATANRRPGMEERGQETAGLSLADFYQMPVRDAVQFIAGLIARHRLRPNDPLGLVLEEVRSRLGYLDEVGLGYLTLDRPTRSLSGGETERVNLTTCLGTRLVNTLFVLDEPSVGLHPRDTERLVRILQQLRDAGNTVVVVEHEASVMRAANQIVDLGPGHGATGGEVVFQGSYAEILRAAGSLTGQYLSGRKRIELPERRGIESDEASNGSDLALNEAVVPYGKRTETRSGPLTRRREDAMAGQAPGLSPSDSPRSRAVAAGGARENRGPSLGGAGALLPAQGEMEARRQYISQSVVVRSRDARPRLKLAHATRHNLKDLAVEIPLGRFVCVTGVSGSGKTTLVREVLLPALAAGLKSRSEDVKASDRLDSEYGDNGDKEESDSSPAARQSPLLSGAEHLGRVVLVDQSILAKTPRSNPAVYIGAFDDIREFFAQSEPARQRGLSASAFSFNSGQGQCERCRGAGFEKIEMQFLSDVFIRCPDCNGRRYRSHILEIKISPEVTGDGRRVTGGRSAQPGGQRVGPRPAAFDGNPSSPASLHPPHSKSIADLLDATVEEAIDFLSAFPESRPAERAVEGLRLLEEVGLGYLRLGQPINTLSGGESQRLKLIRHLAEASVGGAANRSASPNPGPSPLAPCPSTTFFLFDEPTTGLHFDDVRVLLKVFQRLVNAGHSVLVIEHSLDVIKSADWVIDLGPDAGDQGGQIVAQGTPEEIAQSHESHTGRALRDVLHPDRHKSPAPVGESVQTP